MFLIRSFFWILVVVLLLPSEQQPSQGARQTSIKPATLTTSNALVAARETFSDLSGFCTRNQNVCSASAAAADLVQRKAKYAVRLIVDWAHSGNDTKTLTPRRAAPSADRAGLDTGMLLRVAQADYQLITGATHTRTAHAKQGKRPSKNTLEIKDLIPIWIGPKAPTRA